jgi:serine/threonine protein kinase
MAGIPVPVFDFDLDDDDGISSLISPRCFHSLSPATVTSIADETGLIFDPKTPKSCTSNSAVYEAHSRDGTLWAAKICSNIRRAQTEALNRNSLPPNQFLVSTIDLFIVSSKAILQLEYCEGGDLTFLRHSSPNQKFPEPAIWQLIHNISSALVVLHSSGWMHLDISPGNILSGNGVFKLADFGTLTEIGRFEEGSEGAGPYVSPEALEFPHGRFGVTGQTDIFSFGVVLLEMITGKAAPRGGSQGYSRLRQELVVLGSKEYRCECSRELIATVNAMLAVDPGRRPTAEELVRRACGPER